jgi:hypothetical protein
MGKREQLKKINHHIKTKDSDLASISYNFESESLESKSKWFKSLSMEDRMQIFCEYTDIAFALNPNIAEKRDAQSITGRIQVLRKA